MKELKNKYRVATNGEEYCIEIYDQDFFFPFIRYFDTWMFFPFTYGVGPYFVDYESAKKECDRLEADYHLECKRKNLEWKAIEK